jgi:hypothetical protein
MKILVIYKIEGKIDRSTINEHLYAFLKYADADCYYLNTAYGIPEYIYRIDFDLILFHNTFLSLRWAYKEVLDRYSRLKQFAGYKVALPQDEFLNTDSLNKFFRKVGVKTVFTCLSSSQWHKVYPGDKSGLDQYVTVFTGYVDEHAVGRVSKFNEDHTSRPIDIGYRAWRAPYWLGRHGQLKSQLTEKFLSIPVKHSLKLDLSNDEKHIIRGDKWYEFLSSCRVVLGCEGGASLLDVSGSIRRKTEYYVHRHPEASFDEVESVCFPGLDGNLDLFALSPRHFEACVTRTCQALVEGEYGGILKPGIHYIEIKKDWSNIPEVIKQIEDIKYCEQIANNAYRDIVESGLYTYRNFVQQVIEHVKHVSLQTHDSTPEVEDHLRRLQLREKYPYIYAIIPYAMNHLKYIIYRLLVKLNLYTVYKNTELWIRRKS